MPTGSLSFVIKIKRLVRGTQRPSEPERASKSVRAGCRPRQSKPLFIDREGLIRIDKNVAVFVLGMRHFDRDPLMPAMHTADWVGMDRKGDVLVNAAVCPENP